MRESEKKFVIDKFLWMLRLTNEFWSSIKSGVGVLEVFNVYKLVIYKVC